MTYFYIQPLPDEDVGSVLIRAYRQFALPPAAFVRHVLQLKSGYGGYALFRLVESVAVLTALPVARVLAEHTMLSYGLAGHSVRVRRQVSRAVLAGQPSGQGMTFGKVTLRWCEACLRDDVEQYGTAYWHRVHLLPGVTYCVRHGQRLWAVSGQRPNHRQLMHGLVFWGQESLPGEQGGRQVALAVSMDIQREFSRLSETALRPRARLLEAALTPIDLYKALPPQYLHYVGCRYPAQGAESLTTMKLLSALVRQLQFAQAHGVQLELGW